MPTITWDDFAKVDLRVGTIVQVSPFPGARKPAWRLAIDFGPGIGVRHSSAQITDHYKREDLTGTQVIAVVNLPPRQIADFMSEVLVTGLVQTDDSVILIRPDQPVKNGTRLA
jgi:tRNA-binding protein